ncbi:Lrp/AsnC family transcriptional regulator [Epidermidibacterium keratini]|uniref:Lrp/AsnC family transcriptional regulator n=1 Tax=Epidermidibacterium keratini TaxID=1891644 RepID=A0A7L4YJX7_9ACTN|nr:Lrp/AsnC ligand binding domain-containing protein [Epidermidibacterium keratini]QHB99192.1 Lrp/AsnC family transcriptional regulator [Epidermidibacterium keratini]
MITAIVMIQTETSQIPETAQQLADIDGVSEVYSVAGSSADLIAMVRVREFEDIATVCTGSISKVPGVLSTETHIAFQAFSQHDLESTFSIGL